MHGFKYVEGRNVARAHERFAEDILSGTFHAPDFHDAVRLHKLLESIRIAADTGSRIWV